MKREPFSIGWSRAIYREWRHQGPSESSRRSISEIWARSTQGRGRASADIQAMGRSLICFCTERRSVKPRVARASEKTRRLWVCRDKKDWCFPWQNKNHGNTLSKQMSLQNFTFLHSQNQCFPSYTQENMSITYKLVVLQDEPQQCQEAGESHHHWLVPPCHIGFHNLMVTSCTVLQYTVSSKRLRE